MRDGRIEAPGLDAAAEVVPVNDQGIVVPAPAFGAPALNPALA
jgi:hypothetical protein